LPDARARHKGPVPGLHGETALLVVNHFLNIGLLAFRAGAGGRHNAAHKFQRGVRRFRHLVGDAPAGVIVKAQQRACPRAAPSDEGSARECRFHPFLGTRPACVEQVFAGLTIAQRGKRGLLGGVQKRDQPAIV
jgi:hypothetical protein